MNITSATARAGGANSTMALYGASKAALNRITLGLAQELAGSGVRVNAVEPCAAVLTEGAAALVGDSLTADLIESLEAMTEAVVALCDAPAELTGRICVSLDLIAELGLTVYDLDGAGPRPSDRSREVDDRSVQLSWRAGRPSPERATYTVLEESPPV